MTPSDLRGYLRQRGQASLMDLAARFDSDPGLVQDVLGYWQKKGRVRESVAGCGKSCSQCSSAHLIIYHWEE